MNKPTNNKSLIFGIVIVTVLIFGGLIWAIEGSPSVTVAPSTDAVGFDVPSDPSQGPANAPVTVHVFSDFQCPACAIAEPALQWAMNQYKDRVRFVWVDFPLEQIHPNARLAANAARCAEDQGAFWNYHDKLYETQDSWAGDSQASDKMISYAGALGLDKKSFTACLTAKAEDAKIAADIAEAAKNSVDRTPTYFINNRRYFSMPQADWASALDTALVAASSTVSK